MRKTPIPPVPIFADIAPYRNPAARYSYRFAILGLTPVAALVLAPAAILLAAIGLLRYRADPEVEGFPQALTALVVASMTLASNVAGVYCLGRGLGWFG